MVTVTRKVLGVGGSFLHYSRMLWELGTSLGIVSPSFLTVTELPIEGTEFYDYRLEVNTEGIHYLVYTDLGSEGNNPLITVKYNSARGTYSEREFYSADKALLFVYTNTKRRLKSKFGV